MSLRDERPAPHPPTPDDLAGIPVCVEGKEDTTIRPSRVKRREALPSPVGLPTPDDLAGIMVCVEGPEDTTTRPRKRKPQDKDRNRPSEAGARD